MVTLATGLITSPVGINLCVAANVTPLPIEPVARGGLKFLVACLFGLAVIGLVPQLATPLLQTENYRDRGDLS
ncbi:hypothetical protein KUV61_12915 [Nocardioides marinus]|nr:hypothetical protein [Nocardioides marinus]